MARSHDSRSADPGVLILALAVVAALASCATTSRPLLPEHGYPTDWPTLAALSPGLPELEGVYVDEGVAVTRDGTRVSIRLSDLVPRTMPRKGADVETDAACEACVAIRVVPPGRGLFSSQRLRFTLPRGSASRVFDVPAVGSVGSTLYSRGGRGDNAVVGIAVSGAEVRLTCAADGSLIAQLHESGSFLLLMVIPVGSRSEYTWARFQRYGH